MTQDLNREPTIEELAKELEMEPDNWSTSLRSNKIFSHDAGVGRDGDGDDDSVLLTSIEDEESATPEKSLPSQLLKNKYSQSCLR